MSLHSVTQHSHSCHLGTSFFGHLRFPKQTRKFSVKGHGALSQTWRGSQVQDFLCILNCWLTVEAIRKPSPGFWLWSWMKLACGKAKRCRLRCVFLTWNQLALHKYRGFLSQQRSEASRAVRRVRRGRGLSVTSAPAPAHLQAGSWRVFLSKSFLPVFFSLLLLYVFLSLTWFKALCLDVDVAPLASAVAPLNTRPGGTACVGRSCLADGT